MSAIQEEKLNLQKCIGEEESSKVFSLSIQVHNSLEKKDSREISTQSSSKKSVSRISEAERLGFRSFQISITSRISSVINMGSLPPQENGCVVPWRAKCCTTL